MASSNPGSTIPQSKILSGRSNSNLLKLGLVVVSLLLDIVTSSTLFFHGGGFSRFIDEASGKFKFCSSTVDVWLMSLFRCCLVCGAIIGSIFNRREAFKRLSSSTRTIFYVSSSLVIYIVVKFLMSYECNLSSDSKVWFWSLCGFGVFANFLLTSSWYILSRMAPLSNLSTDQESGELFERELLLDSNEEQEAKNEKNKEFITSASSWKLLSYLKPDMGYVALAFFFLVAACAAQIFIPYYTGLVIDGIAIEKNKKKFEMAILTMGLICLGEAICAGFRGAIFRYVASRFNIRINNLLFGSIVNQDISFFDKTKTGEIVSRLTSDTTKMSDQVSLNVNVFLRNVFKGAGVCIFMFKLSWQLSVVTMIGLPLIAFLSEVYGNYYKKLSTAVQDAIARTNEVAAEVVSSMKTVRSFANEQGELNRYKEKNNEVFKLQIKEAVVIGGYNGCTEIMFLAMEVIILYYGGHLVLEGYLTGGNLVSFILYQLELADALEEIGDVYTGLMEAVGAAEKVFKLIDREPAILNNGKVIPLSCEGAIEFKDVSFSYPTRPDIPVLDNVSFMVEPGQVVALVGPSGGGKSTCINLLEHLYEPTGGEVLIDAVPVKDLDHYYLHNKVSLVGQEPVLFARSIKKNIAYGVEDLADNPETVEHVSRLANAHSFVSGMPKGYDTETGEKGLQLSGGQKQRIAIARALIRNPKILLLDEATSALDAESEHLVQDAIYKNLQGHTVLIIAHRLSTIEKADLIIVIDKGQVAEIGTYSHLIAKDGLFNRLVQRQLVGHAAPTSSDDGASIVRHRSIQRQDSDSSGSSVSSGSPDYKMSPPKL